MSSISYMTSVSIFCQYIYTFPFANPWHTLNSLSDSPFLLTNEYILSSSHQRWRRVSLAFYQISCLNRLSTCDIIRLTIIRNWHSFARGLLFMSYKYLTLIHAAFFPIVTFFAYFVSDEINSHHYQDIIQIYFSA